MSFTIQFDESIKWTIGGQDYEVKKPSVKKIAWFNEQHKLAADDLSAQIEITFKFLEAQGLPLEVTERLNSDQVSMILESLFATKKKA